MRPFARPQVTAHSTMERPRPVEGQETPPSRSTLESAAQLAGRLIFGGFFLYNGINHFINRKMLVEYARAKGTPAPEVAVPVSGAMLLAGGASLLTGFQPKVGAALVGAFLLGVTPQMHAFWNEDDQEKRIHELVNFTKNLALLGGSVMAAGHPEPWPYRAA